MKNIVMFKTTDDDYQKFIINFGIVPTLVLLEKFEKLEIYEECQKIIKGISKLNKKANIYKDAKLTEELINDVIDDYRKMGMVDMDKEKLMQRAERYASLFISENSFVIYKNI